MRISKLYYNFLVTIKERISKIIAYNDNSVSISFLSSKGKRSSRTLALPYGIDLETARLTYRNRILEITFNRK